MYEVYKYSTKPKMKIFKKNDYLCTLLIYRVLWQTAIS